MTKMWISLLSCSNVWDIYAKGKHMLKFASDRKSDTLNGVKTKFTKSFVVAVISC